MADAEHVSCNICGNKKTSLVAVQRGFHYVKCRSCGLVYMNPRPELTTLKKIYDTYHQRDGKDESSWEYLMSLNFRAVSAKLEEMFPADGRLLDIGCGYGHFLEIMAGRGWQTGGIDPSAATVVYARGKGLDVMHTTIDEASLPEGSFQAVTMFYVLEHLTDPFAALQKVHNFLAPGGAVVIRIPDTTPIVRLLSALKISNNLYDAPFHLYDFSPGSIAGILARAGFESIEVTPGDPTLPPSIPEKIVSLSTGYAAKFLYRVSKGSYLLPGTSKTVYAVKPGERGRHS